MMALVLCENRASLFFASVCICLCSERNAARWRCVECVFVFMRYVIFLVACPPSSCCSATGVLINAPRDHQRFFHI